MSNLDSRFLKATYGDVSDHLVNIDLTSEKGREELYLISSNIIKEAKTQSELALKNNEIINSTIDQKIVELNYKIKNAIEKLRGAVLAERKTSGAIYTTQIPITKQQTTETTTAKIDQGIAFGISSSDANTADIEVNLLSLNSLNFDNLNLSKLNKNSNDKLQDFILSPKTQHSTPVELTVNLVGILRTDSSLLFEMSSHQIVEVYRNNELIMEKVLLKDIVIPVDITTRSVTIRAYPSIHRIVSLHFKRIGYTELIYNSATYFETKPININKDFYQIVVDTCDNSSDSNININYQISINGEDYEAFTPVSKHNVLDKQSIITTNKEQVLEMFESTMTKKSEGDYRFYIPNKYQLNCDYMHDIYLRNNRNTANKELYISVLKDIQLDKQAILVNSTHNLYINDKKVTDNTLILYKGIYKIKSLNYDRELQPVNIDYLNTLLNPNNIYISRYTKEILTDNEGMKYVVLQNKEFRDSFDSNGNGYFPGLKPKKKIDTVRIKAEMISVDKKTVPFISRLLIRGI